MTETRNPQDPLWVDLNADLGEECGDDVAMLEIVTSANVAAGGHAGGGTVLDATVESAAHRDVNIGAHISYPDRAHFGRASRFDEFERQELSALLISQAMEVHRACSSHGVPLTHIKAHGALYNDAAARHDVAEVLVVVSREVAHALGRAVPLMGMAGSRLEQATTVGGVPFLPEAFADRSYEKTYRLTSRSHPAAVHTTPERVVEQVLDIALRGGVRLADDSWGHLPAKTICLHGDTPGAVRHALAVRAALTAAGVAISGAVIREAAQ